jgi:beta-lactamase class A
MNADTGNLRLSVFIGGLIPSPESCCNNASNMRVALHLFAFATLCNSLCAAQDINQEFERIAAEAGGRVGVSAVLLESGEHIAFHANEPFFMASVAKFPLALRVLALVDEGKLGLDHKVRVEATDRSPGARPLDGHFKAGASFTIQELIEYMIENSDNTACDILYRISGGPPAVQSHLRTLGINGIRVDRTERETDADYRKSHAQFEKDDRDTSTPDAMSELLSKFERGETLKPATTAFLRDSMERSRVAPHRLKGLLPRATVVAHKTGTWRDSAMNDVGIITLPGGSRRIAIAILTGRPKPGADVEHVIAEIGRAVYDHWVK